MLSTAFHIVARVAPPRGASRATALAILLASAAAVGRAQVPDDARVASSAPARDTLRVLFVGTSDPDDGALPGARLGAEEGERTLRLFGRALAFGAVASADTVVVMAAAEQALAGGAAAVVSPCDDPALCRRLAAAAERRGAIVLNVGSSDETLRGAGCSPALFHVAASGAMLADASRAGGGGTARLWLPTLERFGAEQLMQRYRAAAGRAMDERAWAAWLAVKIAVEASLRARSVQPAAVSAWLTRPEAQFDGHKGVPLSFRAWDHQLRQPLYLPPQDAAAGGPDGGAVTVPAARGRGAGIGPRALLDRLGTPAAASACRLDRRE